MKITKLEYQKKDPNRVNIYIDDNFAAGLEVNDIIRLGIHVGQELTKEEQNKLISHSRFGKLFNLALNFLSYRPRSEWEVRHKLQSIQVKNKTESPGESFEEMVIDKLKKINQINDEAFARWFIDQRKTFRPMGRRGIKYELLKKGLDRRTIDKIIIEEQDGSASFSEENQADSALKRRFKTIPKIKSSEERNKLREKMYRFLASRGFDYDILKKAVEKVLGKEYNYFD